MQNHKKLRNTGIIFELLIRRISSDIISGRDSKAPSIIKEFFNPQTQLYKEWSLYDILIKTKFDTESKAELLVNECLRERSKLNHKLLQDEKYNLIRTIKENYDINEFFKYRVNDYKVFASIFKLFECRTLQPADLVTSKFTILEHICQKDLGKETVISEIKEEYSNMDSDMRLLVFKLLIEKFNKKYNDLSDPQKHLLEVYINSISNSPLLKEVINDEAAKIKKQLLELINQVDEDVTKIKLNEVCNHLNDFLKGNVATDEHISILLHYYSLINEIRKTTK